MITTTVEIEKTEESGDKVVVAYRVSKDQEGDPVLLEELSTALFVISQLLNSHSHRPDIYRTVLDINLSV